MRVQVGDLQQAENLRPSQQTGDTYVRPDQEPVNNDMERLAGALGAFSNVAASLARTQAKAQQDDPREAEARRIALSMGDSEFMKAAHEGRLPWQNVPVVSAFYNSQAGERAAKGFLNPIKVGVEDGTIPLVDNDGNPRDVRSIVRESAATELNKFGRLTQSEHFMKSFYSTIDGAGTSIEESARKRQATLNSDTLKNLAATAMDSYLTGPARDQDPAKVSEGLLATYDNIRKIYGKGFPNSAIEDVLMGRLRTQAERDPDTVVKVLAMDRGRGADGQPLGSLLQNGRLSGDAREILLTARKQQATNFDTAQQETAARLALDALKRGDGSFNVLQDTAYDNPYAMPNDRTKKVSASTAKDMALALYEQETAKTLASQRVSPEVAEKTLFERSAGAFINSNVENPKWSTVLKDTGRLLANEVDATRPEAQAKLAAAADLYRKIEDRNPGYAAETLKVGAKEREFFDMARFYEEDMGYEKSLAIQKAATHTSRPKVPLDAASKDKIEKGAARVTSELFSGVGGSAATSTTLGQANNPFEPDVANVMDVQRKLKKIAETIASDGSTPPEKALEGAFKIMRRQSVLINGQAFHGDPYVTKESQPVIQKMLTDLPAQYPGGLRNLYGEVVSGPMSLQPMGGKKGLYRVVQSNGDPVATATVDGKLTFLTLTSQDIQAARQKAQDEIIASTQYDQVMASTQRERAIVRNGRVDPAITTEAQQVLDKAGIRVETADAERKRLNADRDRERRARADEGAAANKRMFESQRKAPGLIDRLFGGSSKP